MIFYYSSLLNIFINFLFVWTYSTTYIIINIINSSNVSVLIYFLGLIYIMEYYTYFSSS